MLTAPPRIRTAISVRFFAGRFILSDHLSNTARSQSGERTMRAPREVTALFQEEKYQMITINF